MVLDMDRLTDYIGLTGFLLEGIGVIVIVIGSTIASVWYVRRCLGGSTETAYVDYRRDLARSIILGLEFLIAGDIIRTVVVEETLANIAALALIIVIRTFLSLTLHLEVEGRWPWQPAPDLGRP